MKRSKVQLVVLFLVVAFAALMFAGTASAGWTWDDTTSLARDTPGTQAAP